MRINKKGISVSKALDTVSTKDLFDLTMVKEELCEICDKYGNFDYLTYNNDIDLVNANVSF